MGQRFRVTLEKEERQSLDQLLSKGKADVRRLKHAQILLMADESKGGRRWSVSRIAEAVACGTATVERVRVVSSKRDWRWRSVRIAHRDASTARS